MEFIFDLLPECMNPYTRPPRCLIMVFWEYLLIFCKNVIVVLVFYMIYRTLKDYYILKKNENNPQRFRRFICRNNKIYEVDWEYSNSSVDSDSSGYIEHLM